MAKQKYVDQTFRTASVKMIEQINTIIEEYRADGYILTVRQLYYQLVARDIIPNTMQSYKNTAELVNNAKLAGLIDWDMLEDRTRNFLSTTRWRSPQQILDWDAKNYHEDMWNNQDARVFVIVEKEALVGVLDRTCRRYDVPLLAARGYPSGSVLREFGRDDIMTCIDNGQSPVILHLGDHDPSGIDMTRDLLERIELFSEQPVALVRLALNMKQVEELKPPENPAKSTDSRFADYKRKFGESSWELDALRPQYLDKLVSKQIDKYIDDELWQERVDHIDAVKAKLKRVSEKWERIK